MYRRDADQQSDSMVLLWDAVASGRSSPAQSEHVEAHGLISEFLALDDTPMPDPAFLNRLEGEVIRFGTGGAATQKTSFSSRLVQAFSSASLRSMVQWDTDPRSRLAGYGRWLAAQAAVALLLLIAIGSVGIIYLAGQSDDSPTIPAIFVDGDDATPEPATPEVETLLNAVIDPAAVGAEGQSEWTTASLFSSSLEPGEGFALDEETWGSSLNVFTMLRGELSVQSGSSSLLFRSGSNVPETVNAGERVTIVAGDSWVAGYGTDVSGQNDGTSDADVLIHANTRDYTAFYPPDSMPGALPRGGHADDTDLALRFDGPVRLDIQRVTLDQDEELSMVVSDSETLLLLTDFSSMVLVNRDGSSYEFLDNAIALNTYLEGAYTITGGLSGTTTLYIARMSDAPAEAQDVSSTPATASASPEATPVVSAVTQPETLLSTAIDPASAGAESQSSWQSAAAAIVTLSSGTSFELDDENWTDGLEAFVLLDGEISVESGSASQIIRAGSAESEPLDAGTRASLAVGDSWIAGIGTSIAVSNTGNVEAKMLMHHQGVKQSVFGQGAGTMGNYPTNFRPNNTGMANTVNPLPLAGPVSLTLERVTVSDDSTFSLDVADDETVLLFNEDGRSFDAKRAGSRTPLMLLGGSAIFEYGAGTYTITPIYDDPLVLYIARARNAENADQSTPVASAPSTEPLGSFLADPAAFPIGNPEEWDEVVAEIGLLEPGASFDASLRNLTCCRFGLGGLHIIDGTMSVELSGPSSVIRAGQDPATPELYEPSRVIALGPGDTIWYGIEAHPFVTNTGSTELNLLNFSVHNFSGDASVEGRLDTYQRPGFSMNSNIYTSDELPLQPGIASTSIQRSDLDPEETLTLTVSENQRQVALIAQGTIQFHKDTGDRPVPPSLINSRSVGLGTAFHTFTPGDYIIENNKDEPATLYVLTITTVPD